ncbi:MAG: alpha-L-arabinofuranosidase, partial [Planctomycetota bacterium]
MTQDIRIDPTPTFALSPDLYMQFMEPLGATDGSVEAAWDHQTEDWRPDVIKATKELAPPVIRFGGCLSSYYRWREGVGPRAKRKPMLNLLWDGIESNQVGTAEFVDLCRRVKARGFYCVNFESDGRPYWAKPRRGGVRTAGPKEAAAWVDYCNRPNHLDRREHGYRKPFDLKLWQIGNETSHDTKGYDLETAAKRTIAFAKTMRKADPEIELIGWGGFGTKQQRWTGRMAELIGEHVQYLAFHHMFKLDSRDPDSPLYCDNYRLDPQATWDALMKAPAAQDA